MTTKLFGTDGIRGRANEFPITAEIAQRMGKAVAAILGKDGDGRKRVIVGKDTRISGDMLESALASGLVSMGVDVSLVGPLPTPAVAFLTKSAGAVAGVMITASHNPYEDNGIKIFGPDGYKLTDALEDLVERRIFSDETGALVPTDEIGQIFRQPEASGRYVESVKNSVGSLSLAGYKIVVDCGHGAAYAIAPGIFENLGATVIATGIEPDGININKGCGALHAGHAGELVRLHRADLGVSFDGDADRVTFTDANGEIVSGDRILALCAIGLKKQGKLRGDTLVATVMSNLGLHEAMKNQGIRVEATAVGDRNVIERIRAKNYSFGGENSGHLIFADHATTGDGILGALQVLKMMKDQKATLADLAAVMDEYPTHLANIPVASKPAISTLPRLNLLMDEATAVFGERGRHLIRYSGTENKIRVLVEHRDEEQVRAWVSKFTAAIHDELG